MSWTSLSVTDETKETVEQEQRDEETVNECVQRVFENYSGESDSHNETHNEPEPDVLTESHIDDIVGRTARRTAEEIETRFR